VKEKSWWLAQYLGCATTVAGSASRAWGLQRDTIASYKLPESCSCGHRPASRSRITRTHRFEPSLLPTENYLEPHGRPRQDVDRHRGVWAYVSRVSVPRRPLNLLLIRTVRELPHRQRRFHAMCKARSLPLSSRHAAGPEG
jgi:hypothetical protein